MGSVVCGGVAVIAIVTLLGFLWLPEGSYPVWFEQLARSPGFVLGTIVGLVGTALGVMGLDQPEYSGIELDLFC